VIFLSCLITLMYTTIELTTFFNICAEFAKLDLLSLENWFAENLNFKETGPFSPNFETMGSDSTIMMANSGSYFGVQAFIIVRVLLNLMVFAIVRKCPKSKLARQTGMRTINSSPLGTIQNESSKMFLESYFDVSIAVFINI
jgi:hypothetical protein